MKLFLNFLFFPDNIDWGGSSSLWDQPSGCHNLQDSHPLTVHLPSTSNSLLGTNNDQGPAEWLWGYNSATCSNNAGGLGAIGSAPRPPPGLNSSQSIMQMNTPTQFAQQQHQQQLQEQLQEQPQQPQVFKIFFLSLLFSQLVTYFSQVLHTFDPFLSLSSIWTPGSPLERWANQQNKDGNKDQNNSRSNQYQ